MAPFSVFKPEVRTVGVGGPHAFGALALGAMAVGATAIGALAIGRLAVGRAQIKRLEIDELVVRKLTVTPPRWPPGRSATSSARSGATAAPRSSRWRSR
jgi:hypothetical protein